MDAIPEIDLEHADPADLRRICHEIGFFTVVGHGVDPALSDRVLTAARAFFALPLEDRMAIDHMRSPQFRGYTRLGEERTKGGRDQREQIDLGADRPALDTSPGSGLPAYMRLQGPNVWPDALPELREAVEPWLEAMERAAQRILRVIARALGHPPGLFDDAFAEAPHVHAKIVHYPGRDSVDSDQGVGEHKDSGFLTLLLLEPGSVGLQVRLPGRQEWVDVTPAPGAFVVNLGEMLEVATGGYLIATPHRVLSPPPGTDRVSVPYFFNPRLDARIPRIAIEGAAQQRAPHESDPENPLHDVYGENALKIWLRANPEVAARHYADVLSGATGQ